MTKAEWVAEGQRRFGSDIWKWEFVCPVCGHIAKAEDWVKVGAPAGAIGYSCIGRYIEGSREAFRGEGKGPCDYAGGGLFRLNPVEIEGEEGGRYMAFAKGAE